MSKLGPDEHASRRTMEIPSPRPLGGEGGPLPAFSPAGAGRVWGSRPWHMKQILPKAFSLVLTPSPTALRSPLSPKGAREEEFLVFVRYS